VATFIDHVVVEAIAGNGGNGCVAFRREKFVPRGGPNGGDGGKGGDVVIQASDRVGTLIDLRYQKVYRAENGAHGRGSNQTGKSGRDSVILVPPGTIISEAGTGRIIAELLEDGTSCLVAAGGKGGLGNARFASSRNRAPRKATPGKPGEQCELEITLKLIADVGLVGEPNAGKSTLLSRVSAAEPEIADYPFTTKKPILGVVRAGEFESFVMVDIPGLIEGAHQGKGMGRDFLRHIERCRVLIYMVDITLEDPLGSYRALRQEILKYDSTVLDRPSLLALTKCDLLPGGASDVDPELLDMHQRVIPISAVSGENMDKLLGEVMGLLK
jgi:GTP-binding protein